MTNELINEIINLRDNKTRMEKYMENFDILKEWSIVIFNDNKKKIGIPDYLKTKTISKNFFNYSPYPTSDFLVFNADSVQAYFDNRTYQYRISGAIELDTNILSYLSSFIENGNEEFKEIFDYLIEPEHNSTINAYLNENYQFIYSKYDKIEKKIKAYEIIKNFDYENYLLNNNVKSYLDEESLKKQVNISMEYFRIRQIFLRLINKNMFDLIYCELLLMIVIEYSYQKNSLPFKLEKFILECAGKLGFIPSREIAIAKKYYLNELKFFDSIQKNNKNVFKKLESMTWDLFHVHYTENAVLFANISDCDLYFPSFLTRDKSLFDALKDYVLDSYAYNSVTKEVISFCDIKKIVFPNKNIRLTKAEQKDLMKIYRRLKESKYVVQNDGVDYESLKCELKNEMKDLLNIF